MKILKELALILIATLCACFFLAYLNQNQKPAASETFVFEAGAYVPEPLLEKYEYDALAAHALREGDLLLLGSSELTSPASTVSYRYVPRLCQRRVLAAGRAGFQSLGMLLTLERTRQALSERSKIAIVLSPGWFSQRGTSTNRFLNAADEAELIRLGADPHLHKETRRVIGRQVRERRDEITGLWPYWALWSFPFTYADEPMWGRAPEREFAPVTLAPIPTGRADFKADEKLERGKMDAQIAKNGFGVTDAVAAELNRRPPPAPASKLDPWEREVGDLFALSSYLKERGVRAHFIMQPVHRRLYSGLESYDALFARVEERLKADGHSWYTAFPEPYDLKWLSDRAHFSDYGWLMISQELCRWLTSN
ncbi:MAG TPA: D-alanyl-lipoteichoic acid biosynthesis protein DltD [Bdellovibrionales bacterium]|nr:D-alanyl-lipoteichoic acid biosynthesis protein DltD [Bdellovibrionales bacterium]